MCRPVRPVYRPVCICPWHPCGLRCLLFGPWDVRRPGHPLYHHHGCTDSRLAHPPSCTLFYVHFRLFLRSNPLGKRPFYPGFEPGKQCILAGKGPLKAHILAVKVAKWPLFDQNTLGNTRVFWGVLEVKNSVFSRVSLVHKLVRLGTLVRYRSISSFVCKPKGPRGPLRSP